MRYGGPDAAPVTTDGPLPDGDLPAAGAAYADAGRRATNLAERDHLVRQAARARAGRLTQRPG